jgi:hypothetical protein
MLRAGEFLGCGCEGAWLHAKLVANGLSKFVPAPSDADGMGSKQTYAVRAMHLISTIAVFPVGMTRPEPYHNPR